MCVSCKNKKIVTRKENLTNSRNGRYENGTPYGSDVNWNH
jgi:hypothetical protein